MPLGKPYGERIWKAYSRSCGGVVEIPLSVAEKSLVRGRGLKLASYPVARAGRGLKLRLQSPVRGVD